eukprot:3754082-Pleurochrysis_carterae.AAC.2
MDAMNFSRAAAFRSMCRELDLAFSWQEASVRRHYRDRARAVQEWQAAGRSAHWKNADGAPTQPQSSSQPEAAHARAEAKGVPRRVAAGPR